MFTVNKSLDEKAVIDLINEVIYNHNESASLKEFKKSNFDGKLYVVAFKLEMPQNKDYISTAVNLLKEKGNFENIYIIEDIHFELSSYEPINADFVISIFEELGLKIEEEYILDRF